MAKTYYAAIPAECRAGDCPMPWDNEAMTTLTTDKYPAAARVLDKLNAHRPATFTAHRVKIDGRPTPWVEVTPKGGTPLRLSAREAELWLSGYVTGRRD